MHPIVRNRSFLARLAIVVVLLAGACASAAKPLLPRKFDVRISGTLRFEKADVISGEYVVAFGNGVAGPNLSGSSASAAAAAEAVRRSEAAEAGIEERRDGSVVLFRYRSAIVGFGARLTPAALAEIRLVPGVRIEPNRAIAAPRDGASDEPDRRPRPLARIASLSAPPPLPPPAVPRGLDRIDRRLPPLDGAFKANFKGKNVHVYVIDTGVLASHNEFGGRVYANEGPGMGYNATKDLKGTGDCLDHGTGVASVIGGKTLGVAPEVAIHPVRVFPCLGKDSSTMVMIAGVDWVAQDRVSKAMAGKPVVVNVSFKAYTSAQSILLDKAIANSVTVGRIPYVIAAGNDGGDACGVSPALVGPAITVGNIKPETDRRMLDSNYGKCVDLFAPGVKIPAAGSGGVDSRDDRNGTSFATPHVTGVVALYLEQCPAAQPAAVWAAILNAANNNDITQATPNWTGISNRLVGSPNVLLHWGSGSSNGVADAPLKSSAQPPPAC